MSDELWEFIQPLLPPAAKEGRPRADDRRTIGAVLFVLKTGIPWNDLPDGYGDDVTAWRRLKEWEEKGVEENHGCSRSQRIFQWHRGDGLTINRQRHDTCQKGGALVGFDGHKRIKLPLHEHASWVPSIGKK